MSKPKLKIKRKSIKFTILFVIIAFLLLVVILFLTTKQKNENNILNQSFFEENECSCLAREKLICNSGFELDVQRRLCKRGNDFTNVILSCSKYECSGIVYELNQNTDKWEKKQ